MTTLRARLARMLEPRAPRPDLRLAAVRKLRAAGIATGVNAMPIIPGLTDSEGDLDALVAAAAEAGAQWIGANVLFLMPAALKQFLPFLKEKYPKLYRQYNARYGRQPYGPEAYREAIAERFRALREKHGLNSRPALPAGKVWRSPQLGLAWQE